MSFERAIRGGAAIVAAWVALIGAQPCHAASPADRAAARRHEGQARDLAQRGQLSEACRHWEEVERLDPKLPALLELAACTEQLGKLVEAQRYWAEARDRAKRAEKPQSRARAQTKAAEVDERVPRLTLTLAPDAAGAEVLCDDVVLAPGSLAQPLALNPGDHSIVVRVTGREDAKYAVKLAERDRRTLAITAGSALAPATSALPAAAPVAAPVAAPAPAAAVAPPAPAPAPDPNSESWWTKERTSGVVLGAVGLAAVGGGTALCVVASKDGSSVDHRLSAGAISLVSGGVLLVTGVALLASTPAAGQSAGVRVAPGLALAPGTAALTAFGRF